MHATDFPYDELAPYSFDLSGKTAIVTGGAGHLGIALSNGLAAAGAHVNLIGRNTKKLTDAVSAIIARGQSAEYTVLDLSKIETVRSFAAKYTARGKVIDILVNNAYAGPTGTLQAATAENYSEAYHIAVVVAAELVRCLEPCFQAAVAKHGDASVINIASMYGHVSPDPDIYGDSGQNSPPYYGAAKGALLQYTRYAAVHLASQRIRVNAISPGPFPPLRFREEKPEFYEKLVKKVPMKRIGTPQDMIGPLVFLASANAQFVTGMNLCVDGGWTAW
ncbi:2-deoxy-D-gluconate 3-dehydrogenase (plasmid) [Maritalea myrionectae]|uniref:2-deoxy-D-gluconate 3-dehydrogenase n=1 Tax=Maritalea myrionectae TaxID=454601 RepID=A0A2R4MJI0_9HYPH|nr:SDR family oxidoreductase [Maritalea myrionectae]AVX06118.1 2-deoxy-D-gluconate 3-dehydrogenase [Maritalea myrionectae]